MSTLIKASENAAFPPGLLRVLFHRLPFPDTLSGIHQLVVVVLREVELAFSVEDAKTRNQSRHR